MERPRHTPEQPSELEQLLATLPDPKQAVGFITAILADKAQETIFEAQATGQEIDPVTARLIAYNLAAHAPDDTDTARLRRFFDTGHGSHEQLRDEYLPLRLDPVMQPEGHLLVDALGTYLANRENPARRRARRLGQVSFAILSVLGGERHGLLFKTARPIGNELGATAHILRLARMRLEHGDAFTAYLRAPGVDATADDIEARFRTAYIGSAADLETIRHAPDSTSPVPWRAVEIGGQTHVFHA